MYLTDVLILNSGPLDRFSLKASFNPDGSPKPMVFVGQNGAGKTTLLSVLSDGLFEIAALHFQNVLPYEGMNRKFFRVLGGRTTRIACEFELCALRFAHGQDQFTYRAVSGNLAPDLVFSDMAPFGPEASSWEIGKNHKSPFGKPELVKDLFMEGVYAFFPSTRFEAPYWANLGILERDPKADFSPAFDQTLPKPIIVQSSLQELKPWLLELITDSNTSLMDTMNAPTLEVLRDNTKSKASLFQIFHIHQILTAILKQSAWIQRTIRGCFESLHQRPSRRRSKIAEAA